MTDWANITRAAVAEWRGGRTSAELREVYGLTVEVRGFDVQIVPRPLRAQSALSVDAIMRDGTGDVVHTETIIITDG